jgi:Zn-dependent protease
MGIDANTLRDVPLWVIAFLISGSFHEFFHAWTAYKLGDPTAERMGRLTMNPIVHIDPVGLIFLIIMTFSGIGIGWMKPVPVNPFNFRRPRQGNMLVALAGPLSNIAQVIFFVIIFKIFPILLVDGNRVGLLLGIFLLLNILLAVFNLLPIPPLDGGHIVEGLLPESMVEAWERFSRFGFFVLIFLMITGILGKIFSVVLSLLINMDSMFISVLNLVFSQG